MSYETELQQNNLDLRSLINKQICFQAAIGRIIKGR